eukprot:TRINITY_DN30266_c0_g1_i1.p2 TRINITY_DN30266_c0_g1~~TRINITY_DN30266_c0_g1_i1.p2  ORF type:complete len:209 (+),score=23.33 TRINITY_DN30266_c0_g1_i1:403-1029(+)
MSTTRNAAKIMAPAPAMTSCKSLTLGKKMPMKDMMKKPISTPVSTPPAVVKSYLVWRAYSVSAKTIAAVMPAAAATVLGSGLTMHTAPIITDSAAVKSPSNTQLCGNARVSSGLHIIAIKTPKVMMIDVHRGHELLVKQDLTPAEFMKNTHVAVVSASWADTMPNTLRMKPCRTCWSQNDAAVSVFKSPASMAEYGSLCFHIGLLLGE